MTKDIFTRLQEMQAPPPPPPSSNSHVKVSASMKANRGKLAGDGSGKQTKITFYRGDTIVGKKHIITSLEVPDGHHYVQPGEEHALCMKMKNQYGPIRVTLEYCDPVTGKRRWDKSQVYE